jgi:hypothetical protein
MSEEEALAVSRGAIGETKSFPYPQYPLVSENDRPKPWSDRPINILLLFVEGLDRRYLGRTEVVSMRNQSGERGLRQAVELTPFLDRLRDDSFYFSHFFSNGVQTARGLFSTLCSALPRQGTAAIKTRQTHDYLCLPSLLRKAGYSTEMLVGLDSDLPGLRQFLKLNGIDRYYGEGDFPERAERLGIGVTDGGLLGMIEERVEVLQGKGSPFLLTALTSGMHHPFAVPSTHAEVHALRNEPDQYLAALRYFDLSLEESFSRLQSKGLLTNTVVLILGDHGRHEPIGRTQVERQVGHFLAPLFIWLDPSLRASHHVPSRWIHQVASQVDIMPTLLSINGVTPHLSPFVGHDLTCLFSEWCLNENTAYLSSVYDDLIGLATSEGLWLHSFRRGVSTYTDLDFHNQAMQLADTNGRGYQEFRLMTALYLTFNVLIETNGVWSWPFLGGLL